MITKNRLSLLGIAFVMTLNVSACSSVDHSPEIADCQDQVTSAYEEFAGWPNLDLKFEPAKYDDLGSGMGRITGSYTGMGNETVNYRCSVAGAHVTMEAWGD